MALSDIVTLLKVRPASLSSNPAGICFVESSLSLNSTISWPVPVSYVADVKAGFVVSRTVMGCFAAAATGLPAASLTAPASMCSLGSARPLTEFLSAASRVNVSELVPLAVMVPLDMVTPPEFWLNSRTWNFDATCFEASSASLNVMVSWPEPVRYVADAKVGLVTSAVVTVWFRTAEIALPYASLTAPASMCSCGEAMASTMPLAVEFRVNAR